MTRNELVEYLDNYLQCARYKDAAPNGLQISGKNQIEKIIVAVTASQSILDFAAAEKADAVLVHHGYFWKGETQCITGVKRNRIARLLQHDINLLAYHLPLDAHPIVGNNAQLGLQLGLRNIKPLDDGLLYSGELLEPLTGQVFQKYIAQILGRLPQHIAVLNRPIKTLAWCTGAAQDHIIQAAELGVDAFLSGEISERTYYLAQELGIDYFACGHHATERYGIQALGQHLAEQFPLTIEFVDTDNPV